MRQFLIDLLCLGLWTVIALSASVWVMYLDTARVYLP